MNVHHATVVNYPNFFIYFFFLFHMNMFWNVPYCVSNSINISEFKAFCFVWAFLSYIVLWGNASNFLFVEVVPVHAQICLKPPGSLSVCNRAYWIQIKHFLRNPLRSCVTVQEQWLCRKINIFMHCRTSNQETWLWTKTVSWRFVPSFFHHKREKCKPLKVDSNTLRLVYLQILDFGLARHAEAEMTGYVVTRWYRAPEVILNWMHYTQTGKMFVIH